MTTLTIKSTGFYNNAASKLNINLSNGKTMCANVLDSDKRKYLSKKMTIKEMTSKYFHFDGQNFQYSNPTK